MVVWRDPGDAATEKVSRRPVVGLVFQQEADELRANPEAWGIIREYDTDERPSAYNTVNAVKAGRYGAFRPPGSFDAKTVTEENSKGSMVVNVYAIYLGDQR